MLSGIKYQITLLSKIDDGIYFRSANSRFHISFCVFRYYIPYLRKMTFGPFICAKLYNMEDKSVKFFIIFCLLEVLMKHRLVQNIQNMTEKRSQWT